MNDIKYIKPKEASEIIGVNLDTLRRMAGRNEIKHIRTDTGRYLFDVSSFLKRGNPEVPKRKKICYARVSGRGQKSDLQNQIELLKTKYPETEVISDYGSGLNFHRKGLEKIMDLAYKGELEEVVVTYKDRLCRFGFELIEYILKTQSNAKIVVLNQNSTSKESELASDLLSIITVFSARMHGLRKYRNQIKEDENLFQKGIQTKNETDDRIL
jgi:predicted site-specific integrase-resolvase